MKLTQQEIDISETAARCRRMETRLHKLCERMEVESPNTPIRITDAGAEDYIEVPGFDVTLSKVKAAMIASGIDMTGNYQIVLNGVPIGDISFYKE